MLWWRIKFWRQMGLNSLILAQRGKYATTSRNSTSSCTFDTFSIHKAMLNVNVKLFHPPKSLLMLCGQQQMHSFSWFLEKTRVNKKKTSLLSKVFTWIVVFPPHCFMFYAYVIANQDRAPPKFPSTLHKSGLSLRLGQVSLGPAHFFASILAWSRPRLSKLSLSLG